MPTIEAEVYLSESIRKKEDMGDSKASKLSALTCCHHGMPSLLFQLVARDRRKCNRFLFTYFLLYACLISDCV